MNLKNSFTASSSGTWLSEIPEVQNQQFYLPYGFWLIVWLVDFTYVKSTNQIINRRTVW